MEYSISPTFLIELYSKLPIDEDDVSLIFEEIHRGRSVIPPHNVPSRPTLVRWDLTRALTVDNCVVMEHKDAERHIRDSQSDNGRFKPPHTIWGEEVVEVVERRSEEIRRIRQWIM